MILDISNKVTLDEISWSDNGMNLVLFQVVLDKWFESGYIQNDF